MEFFTHLWLGMPIWVWLSFIAVVLLILAFDLGVLHKEAHEIDVKESLYMSALYIGLGLAWAVAVWWIYYTYGSVKAIDPHIAKLPTPEAMAWEAVKLYITGYLVEKALAMDNVFVISMIFAYFAVPRIYQHRVLFWGILGVIVLRAIMIGLGAALVMNFSWILYVFAVILILTGVKMLYSIDDEPDIANNFFLNFLRKRMRLTNELHGQKFWVKLPDSKSGKLVWFATPLFLCLILVEIAVSEIRAGDRADLHRLEDLPRRLDLGRQDAGRTESGGHLRSAGGRRAVFAVEDARQCRRQGRLIRRR